MDAREENEVLRVLEALQTVARAMPPSASVQFRKDLIDFAYRWIQHDKLRTIAPLITR